MVIPAALLRRFFVDGSLRNKEEGVGFELRNLVAPTTMTAFGPIEIDDLSFAADEITLVASKVRPASAISSQAPLFLAMGTSLTVRIHGLHLPAGEHQITIHAITREVGAVVIDVTETI